MQGLQKLTQSKRFWTAVLGLLTSVLAQFVDPNYVEFIVQITLALIVSFTGVDVAMAAKGNKTE